MTVKVWDGSKWAIGSQIKVWDGSDWKDGTNTKVHVWSGSVWQQIHPPVYLDQQFGYILYAADPNSPPFAFAQSQVTVYANGTIQGITADSVSGTQLQVSDTWLLNGVNSEYDVFVTNFSGTALDGGSAPTNGTRSVLSTDRFFSLSTAFSGVQSAAFNLVICANNSSGTGNNVEIQNTIVTLSADVGFV